MPDNYYSEVNDHGNVIPIRDLAAYNGVIANTKLIKDTVGWSGKNKAIPQEGYALDGNDSTGFRITISGTNSLCYIAKVENGKSYIVSREAGNRFRIVGFKNYPSTTTKESTARDIYIGSASDNTYTFTNTGNWAYVVFMVNYDSSFDYSTAHGMIRDANILDDTYEPYFGSTAVDWSSYAKTGVHNLLVNNAASITSQGVTFTVNADKHITVANQQTGQYQANLILSNGMKLKKGTYTITNKVTGTFVTDFPRIGLEISGGSTVLVKPNETYTLNLASDTTFNNVFIGCGNAGDSFNCEVYPMLKIADDSVEDYDAPAMTNKELTEKVQGIIDAATNAADFAAFKTAIGNL